MNFVKSVVFTIALPYYFFQFVYFFFIAKKNDKSSYGPFKSWVDNILIWFFQKKITLLMIILTLKKD